MITFTNEEINRLTDLQKALLILIIEKETGTRYNLVHLKKAAIKHYVSEAHDKLTKSGKRQLKNIIKKLKL